LPALIRFPARRPAVKPRMRDASRRR
jgi:hypothetical protein